METLEIIKTKSFIVDQLEECQKRLLDIELALVAVNKDEQFDFTTSSRLADLVGNIESRINSINSKVYQKG